MKGGDTKKLKDLLEFIGDPRTERNRRSIFFTERSRLLRELAFRVECDWGVFSAGEQAVLITWIQPPTHLSPARRSRLSLARWGLKLRMILALVRGQDLSVFEYLLATARLGDAILEAIEKSEPAQPDSGEDSFDLGEFDLEEFDDCADPELVQSFLDGVIPESFDRGQFTVRRFSR